MEEVLIEKLKELKEKREKFIVQVNGTLAHMNGQIDILEEMLKEKEQNEEHAE